MAPFVIGLVMFLAGQQASTTPPVFKSGAYRIAIEIPVFEGRKWCRGSKPITNLTAADFTVSLDKKRQLTFELTQDPKRPGRYLLSFAAPEAARDGKEHRLDVTITKRGGLNWVTTIPKPSDTVELQQLEDWISEACK
jgi:hypothetical protein